MSLLMQALKKAERARQNGLPEEHPAAPDDWGLEPRTGEPPPGFTAATPEAALESAPAPRPPAALGELSLEPLEPSAEPRRPSVPETGAELKMEPSLPPAAVRAKATRAHIEPPIPLEPATEALHDPVPPQARHEPARNRAPAGTARGATPQPDAPAKAATTGARPEAAAARAGAAARARAAAAGENPGLDMARMRVAGLSGIALVILATFGYVYWRATTAPGPGAALPMVPMPPPSATGATGIAVAPAGPPFGPATAVVAAGTDMPAAVAPVAADTPAAPASTPAVVASPPASVPAAAAPAPQRYVHENPAIERAVQQDEMERMERNMRAERERAVAGNTAPSGASDGAVGAPASYAAPPAMAAAGDVRIARGSAPAIAPAVSAAYAAFVAGDYATARREYDNALVQDPNNRDALLGSAAVAQRENRGVQAAANYVRLLELDPADPDALAALVALRPGDLARSESQLRNVLKSRPDAAPVLFALGNLYARQNRWSEAQQAYFRAYTAAPGNADYAFNLAVGLDRLNQGKLAATYYQQALAATGPAGYDRAAVQRRLRELREAVAPAPEPPAPVAGMPTAGN